MPNRSTVNHLWKKGGLKAVWTWGESGPNARSRLHRWIAAHAWAHHRAKQGGPERAHFLKAAHEYAREAKAARAHVAREYGAGGWAPTKFWVEQRIDQGQDFEIHLNDWVVSPGDGEIVAHGADRPFPYGFGDPHAIVRIDTGPFKGRTYYCGHANADVQPVGTKLKFGSRIARANHFLNAGLGWVEIGVWPYPPMGSGAAIHDLFRTVRHK